MDNKEKNTEKTNNVNNSKTIIIILSSVIATCLIVIIILLCLLLKKSDDNKSAVSDTTVQSESSGAADNSSLTIGTPDDSREAIEISTKYGTLLYPKEWESNLRTEVVDKDEYKVEFYGTVEGKKEQHLFDLSFNGTDGYNLGTLKIESGENVSINIVSYDFELDDTWTEDEKNVICAMQEDINYTIGMLAEGGNFTVS